MSASQLGRKFGSEKRGHEAGHEGEKHHSQNVCVIWNKMHLFPHLSSHAAFSLQGTAARYSSQCGSELRDHRLLFRKIVTK